MDIHSKRGGVKPALATIATICMILSVVIVIKTDVWTLVKGNISFSMERRDETAGAGTRPV